VLDAVLNTAKRMAHRQEVDLTELGDERNGLVLEPLRWVLEAMDAGEPYEWVVLEQVPTVLPVWQAFAEALRTEGYGVDVGYLHAEAYGVPQTRKRAILVARLGARANLPAPTHSRYYPRSPTKLDPGTQPWVSMAEALGWGFVRRPAYTFMNSGHGGAGVEWGGNGSRKAMFAAAESGDDTVWITKWREELIDGLSRVRDHSGSPVDLSWPARRPATVVATRDLIQHPGSTANRFQPGVTKTRNDGIRVTTSEAGVLQSFPPDYAWSGTRSDQYRQVGNAIPVLLASAVLMAATTPTKKQGASSDDRAV
jgi:DNA (cytosine-5)-methyltransferase 1